MDGKGVTGFPWRISLAFLLVALCVPPLAGLAEGFQDTADGCEIQTEIEQITNSASTVYLPRPIASRSLTPAEGRP